ncbi:protein phosphatase [Cyanobium sp. FACHB-13342]|nr:protein phosphatase [Cyanobium sp. FACHB-13342]
MAGMKATNLQATLFDFAIGELVRQHRESFQPLWSTESWAKLMIWLSLNCGCSGDREGLEAFAGALGPVLSGRMRRLFFERELEDLDLQVMADPAEQQVLVMPMGPPGPLDVGRVAQALERVGLGPQRVAPRERWQELDAVVAIPWLDLPEECP